MWGDALGSGSVRDRAGWRKAGLGVPVTGVAQDSAFHVSWLTFFPFLPPPLSLSRQAQSSAQLMDLFQVRWTQGQCTMGTHGS